MTPSAAYRQLKAILTENDLPDLRFHDLRHTFATYALANGVDAKTLSGILGHTKASFTVDTYTHTTTDMYRKATKIVGGCLTDYLGEEMAPWQSAETAVMAVSTRELVPDQPKPGILLADWLDLWYQGYKKPNLRPNTQPSYERRIYQHTIPAFGGTQLDKLTPADIQEFYVSLKKGGQLIHTELYGEGLSDQTVRGIHTTLHAALDKVVEENPIFRNFSEGYKLPSAKPREMKVMTPMEIQRFTDPGQRGWLL